MNISLVFFDLLFNSLKQNSLWIYLIGIVVLNIIVKKIKIKLSGYLGERKVKKFLKKLEKKGYVILNDVLLPLYDKTTQVDHIVIGPSGITVIETKNYKGIIQGSNNSKYWIQRLGLRQNKFYNPLWQNNTHVKTIRYLLNKNGIKNVIINNLVVFTSKQAKLLLDDNTLPVVNYRGLKLWFKIDSKKPCFLDVLEVARILKKYEITDSEMKRKHVKYVKKIAKTAKI